MRDGIFRARVAQEIADRGEEKESDTQGDGELLHQDTSNHRTRFEGRQRRAQVRKPDKILEKVGRGRFTTGDFAQGDQREQRQDLPRQSHLQEVTTTPEVVFHRTLGDAHDLRDLAVTQARQIAQFHDTTDSLGKRTHGIVDRLHILSRERGTALRQTVGNLRLPRFSPLGRLPGPAAERHDPRRQVAAR